MAPRKKRRIRKFNQKIPEKLCYFAVFVAPLLLGGNRDWAYIILGALLFSSFVVLSFSKNRQHWTLIHWVLALPLLLTTLQLIPLPAEVLRIVSNETYNILMYSLMADWKAAPLSLDPAQTQHELLKLIGYFVCACVLFQLKTRDKRNQTQLGILKCIALSGTTLTLTAAIHLTLGLKSTFGAFAPADTLLLTTFVNPNHAAAFLGLATFCSLSIYLHETNLRANSELWLANAGLLVIALLSTLSRAGILSFVISSILLAIGLIIYKEKTDSQRSRFIATFVLLSIVGGTAYFFFPEVLSRELSSIGNSNALSKTRIWFATPDILDKFWFSGIGRGAFYSAFPIFSPATNIASYTHLENEYLQALVDWGPIWGTLVIFGFIVAVLRAFHHNRYIRANWPVLAASVYLGLHNIMDFNLSTMGVALPWIALLTTLTPLPPPSIEPRKSSWVIIIPLLLLFTGTAIASWNHSLDSDTDAAQTLVESGSPEATDFIDGAIRRHPGDYFLHTLKVRAMLQDEATSKQVFRHANAALYLGPQRPGSHLSAADLLIRSGNTNQAFTHYRQVIEMNSELLVGIAKSVTKRFGSIEAVTKLAGFDANSRLPIVYYLNSQHRPDLALKVLEDYLGEEESILRVRCSTQLEAKQYTQAIKTAARLKRLYPQNIMGYYCAARAHMQLGNIEDALNQTTASFAISPTNVANLKLYVQLLLKTKRYDHAHKYIKQLEILAKIDREKSEVYALRGEFAHLMKRYKEAKDAYLQAFHTYPLSAEYLKRSIEIELATGSLRSALELLARQHQNRKIAEQIRRELLERNQP